MLALAPLPLEESEDPPLLPELRFDITPNFEESKLPSNWDAAAPEAPLSTPTPPPTVTPPVAKYIH